MEPDHGGPRGLDLRNRVAVMAVVNRTPDSFYEGARTVGLEQAVTSALQAADLGADWVDVGGVPFGRGPDVTTTEEIDRVVPVVERLAEARPELVVSVDTYRAEVARAAITAGASVVNDTSGLADPDMAQVVADGGAHVILCHSAGRPRQEKPAAHYEDVVAEVRESLLAQIASAQEAGVPRERIIIDPGHDLDKNTLHSLELTRRLGEIAEIGLPLLVAVSNKDFIGESIDRPQGERLAGSLAAMTACILAGARIVRMHDIAATVDAVRMSEAILGLREPARLEHNMHPTHNV
ncbi:dihydropteroate synthase [Brachybacterium endophyticum]|uniref:Dihydropteroate synthase n=1 Tax=Brachybacterium endophyticum TaxID=2182385 RepID=A0A2U2RKN0_9MICO|nr:dihydropteroate synthase [Brachybacterium endophyticum]PWH06420.1 dihydropteroate synthase [Brachybacterium endophyticum]